MFLNPRKAFVVFWKDFPYRFVFSHEASYCQWFELPSGAGLSYQFSEGNEGWADLFNDWGRRERNSFVDVLESGPDRVWVRRTYIGVDIKAGEGAYRGTEDFGAYPNGLIVRRRHDFTRLKEHSHRDTGGVGWVSSSWDHWPRNRSAAFSIRSSA